jgi:hypothetical protein|tara:strand:+ start:1289 stop:1714 length:426 start_codon:yes stop_codon:yes gene_type:complete
MALLRRLNMAASLYDFNIEQGSSFRMTVVYKDANNNPVDIRNWCARIIWKTNTNTTQTFSSTNSDASLYKVTVVNDASGTVKFELPASVTNAYDFNNAKYDFELESNVDHYTGGGKYVIRILYGTVTLLKRNSKSSTLLSC